MSLQALIEKLKSAREKATKTGVAHFSKPIVECADIVKESMISAVDESVKFDPSIPFRWVTNAEGLHVAFFGCGPSSKANQDFFILSANEILKLCEAAELMMNSLIIYKDWGNGLSPQETLEIANSICGDVK